MILCRAVSTGRAARQARLQTGFTLVELVVVLVVMGLLAVVAVPRFFDNQVYAERTWYDEVIAAMRYARTLAIGSGCPVRVTLGAGSYSVAQQAVTGGHCNTADTSWPVAVRTPDGEPMTGSAPMGVITAPALVVIFDAAGTTNLVTSQSITVGPRSFTLHAGSGLVSP